MRRAVLFSRFGLVDKVGGAEPVVLRTLDRWKFVRQNGHILILVDEQDLIQ